jgi:uncharacterized membrane protein YqjE
VGAAVAQLVKDRLDLIGLELREGKIRLLQALILACGVAVLGLFGLILAVLALVFLLPPELRGAGLAVSAVCCLGAAAWAYGGLKRSLSATRHLFAQTVAELEKDKACF